jgi:hypothetical protein
MDWRFRDGDLATLVVGTPRERQVSLQELDVSVGILDAVPTSVSSYRYPGNKNVYTWP